MNIIEKIFANKHTNMVIGFIIIIAIVGIIVLSIQAYVKSTSDENTINTLQGQIQVLESQLSSTKAQLITLSAKIEDTEGHIASSDYQQDTTITLLQDGLAQTSSDINVLNIQVNSLMENLSRLKTEISNDTASISSIEVQLSSLNSHLSSLSNTTTSLQNKLNSLENTVNSLSNTIKYLIPPATNPVVLFSSQTIYQGAGTQTLLYTFTPPKNGYIYISGSSNSTSTYIGITNNTASTFQNYIFGAGTTLSIPLMAGYNYSIILGNTAPSGTVTAKLTAIYYY
jgi:uncharacterized protein YlxW (UPF0749 family)